MANRLAHFTTNLGDFQVELFEDRAPATTKNFIDLVERGFYDGIVFQRVIEGFMLQGGSSSNRRVWLRKGRKPIVAPGLAACYGLNS